MRARGGLGIIGHDTKSKSHAPQLSRQSVQICHQNLRRRFRLLIEPITDLRVARGRNIAVDHRRNLHGRGGNDDTAGLHSLGVCVIAKRLRKLPQQRLIRPGDARQDLSCPNAPGALKIKQRAVLVENDPANSHQVQCTCSAPGKTCRAIIGSM